MQKQKVAKTFDLCVDSLKVRDSPLIHDSPKWILRYTAFRLSNDEVGCGFALRADLICLDCFALPLARTRNDELFLFYVCFIETPILALYHNPHSPLCRLFAHDSH